jgi:hypothetical protein
MLRRGDLVELDGLLAVVVALAGELVGMGELVPEDHVALWFGTPPTERPSEGGEGGAIPEVWTVPADYCRAAPNPVIHH